MWETVAEALGLGLVIFLFVLGLFGVIIPLLPGILLIWLGVLGYALINGFTEPTALEFAFITLLGLVAGTADWWLPLLGARTTGASWKTLILALAGAIIGTFVVPILGTVIGYAAGIILGEYLRLGDLRQALRASVGGIVGWGVGTAVQLAGAVVMILVFAATIR